ncbi:MAG: hypothetical protein IKB64_09785, partial [Paludibacteraceae bacterium]|nr:hypothetical protein [Paludibacteraceae bacterium]
MNPKNQWEDIEARRASEQAMDNIITNNTTDPLTSATNQFKQQDTTNPYDKRQEFYSKYSLLDENLKPIQTYTEWRQQNPTAPPVQDQDTFMFLDKRDEYKEMLKNQQITETQYLRDLYQIDILKENGYDIRNVG